MAAHSPDLAAVASAIADDSRAAMLLALMDGRAWTASELAQVARIGRPTATAHLDLLVTTGLLTEVRQGRHRYLRIADTRTAEVIESLAALATRNGEVRPVARTLRAQHGHARLRFARTCYGHLAGALGVGLADGLRSLEYVSPEWSLTPTGSAWLRELGVDLPERPTRAMLRPCLDWTERREHLAGIAADRLLSRLLELDALRLGPTHREVVLTDAGRSLLEQVLPAQPRRAAELAAHRQ